MENLGIVIDWARRALREDPDAAPAEVAAVAVQAFDLGVAETAALCMKLDVQLDRVRELLR